MPERSTCSLAIALGLSCERRARRGRRRADVREGRPADLQGVLPRLPRRGRGDQGPPRPASQAFRGTRRRQRPGSGRGSARREFARRAAQERGNAARREEGARGTDRSDRALDRGRGGGEAQGARTPRSRDRPDARRAGVLGVSADPPASAAGVRTERSGPDADRRVCRGEAARARAFAGCPTPTSGP